MDEQRSINELIDLPYSEMTEEEIERVVEFKAGVKARDEAYQQGIKAIKEGFEQVAQVHKLEAEKHEARLNELTDMAIARFKEVS